MTKLAGNEKKKLLKINRNVGFSHCDNRISGSMECTR